MSLITLVVCGAPLAGRAVDLAEALAAAGSQVDLVGTPAATAWIDHDEAVARLGSAPRVDFRVPAQPKTSADPDTVLVCPASFNTVNKVAAGVADNYATALVCEAIGMRTPTLVAPMINNKLWGHPGLSSSFARLRDAGVRFLDIRTGDQGLAPVESGTGDLLVRDFDPAWLVAAARALCGRSNT